MTKKEIIAVQFMLVRVRQAASQIESYAQCYDCGEELKEVVKELREAVAECRKSTKL